MPRQTAGAIGLYSPVCIRLGRLLQWQHHQKRSARGARRWDQAWLRQRCADRPCDPIFPLCFLCNCLELHTHTHTILSATSDKWVQNTIWLHPSMCAFPINDVYSPLSLPIAIISLLFSLNLSVSLSLSCSPWNDFLPLWVYVSTFAASTDQHALYYAI